MGSVSLICLRPSTKIDCVFSLGGVPREQKMLQRHLPRVIYHRVYSNIRRPKVPIVPTCRRMKDRPGRLLRFGSGVEGDVHIRYEIHIYDICYMYDMRYVCDV